MFTKADLQPLEFPRLLELAAALAASEPGQAAVRALLPSPFPGEVRERLDRTAELDALLGDEPRLDFSGLVPLEDSLAILAIEGAVLTLAQFRSVFGVVSATGRVRRRLLALPAPEPERPDRYPFLRERGRLLPEMAELERMRIRYFDAEGELRDDATPELSRIRRAVVSLRSEIQKKALQILRGDPSVFQDTTVVQRGERWCLPVKAEMRGRVPGILHERSQTGATVFIEPMAIVEMNNELSSLREEEAEEIRRILREATAALALRREEIAEALFALSFLDALQAQAMFGRLSDAIRPEVSVESRIDLRAARHPLLDERLAKLRRRVFGEAEEREKRRVVPVDVALEPGARVLLLTGPNAGGKTATLKVIGLSAAMAQAGFFVPAAPGSTLPVFENVAAHVGDTQDLLSDLSSFSSYMAELSNVLRRLGPRSLVLLDELGSATDPEEGGALAAAVLEAISSAGGTAIVTTHLGFLKSWAERTAGSALAAMEYDATSGRPTYRVLPGIAGRSFALSLAERAGLPAPLLARARALLGEGWVARERAEEALERSRGELERERMAAAVARREREEERSRLEQERAKAAEDARKDRLAHRREMDRLKRVADEALSRAVKELSVRAEAAGKKSLERDADRLRSRVVAEVREGSELPEGASRPVGPFTLRVGDRVRLEGLGSIAILRELAGERATIEVGGKMMKVAKGGLVPAEAPGAPSGTSAPRRASHAMKEETAETVPAELNLIGQRVDEARDAVDEFLDRALRAGRPEVRIIHGYGTGRLRDGVREHLRKHPAVVSQRSGEANEGGDGATVVKLE